MPLNQYQLHILRDIRAEENKVRGLQFISLTTGAGYSALDAYRKQSYTEITTLFSGSVLFNPAANKQDSAGGFYNLSELTIVASRDYKTTAQTKDTKILYEGIKFRVNQVTDCKDSDEIVIAASRLE